MPDNSPALKFADARSWEAWLSEHHSQSDGVWLVIAKKGFEEAGITISDALDIALCFGWIDSQRKGLNEKSYLQRYSPRRPKSPWSKLNVERVEALANIERMRPRGLAEVAAAQADGRWAVAYQSQRIAEIPDDFTAAMNEIDSAAAAFALLDKSSQYALILPILKATTSDLRAVKIRQVIARLRA